jgi:hypothetical protein
MYPRRGALSLIEMSFGYRHVFSLWCINYYYLMIIYYLCLYILLSFMFVTMNLRHVVVRWASVSASVHCQLYVSRYSIYSTLGP